MLHFIRLCPPFSYCGGTPGSAFRPGVGRPPSYGGFAEGYDSFPGGAK
jgi:hypothetical protein